MPTLRGNDRLDELARDPALRKPKWDSYNAEPLKNGAVERTRLILNQLGSQMLQAVNIVPTTSGGLQLDCQSNGFSIEIGENSDIASVVRQISQGVSR